MILFQDNDKFKIQILFGSVLIAIIGILFFYKPTVTGHVPVNIYIQNLSLVINESQNFLLTSDNLEPFTITSFKMSGNITGSGQVRIYIDSGRGQKILVHENIAKKSDKSGILTITGRVIDDTENKNTNEQDKWLIIKPISVLLEKEVFYEVGDDEYLVSGDFNQKCIDTCFIKMEMSRDIAYRLIFLVEEGTLLKINEIVYQTEELSV